MITQLTCQTCPHFTALDDQPTRKGQGVRGNCALFVKVTRAHWAATRSCQELDDELSRDVQELRLAYEAAA
ncbi:hypothetical protein [Anthocerotibacter panamensis]|uniref:hypothetical protein n=1 Tax=Anthocerotibacter panamensis TaxID=2857077 RepID=UPI001C40717F|nr:hypothetical protein [Anthocerotibacter panamensis]